MPQLLYRFGKEGTARSACHGLAHVLHLSEVASTPDKAKNDIFMIGESLERPEGASPKGDTGCGFPSTLRRIYGKGYWRPGTLPFPLDRT